MDGRGEKDNGSVRIDMRLLWFLWCILFSVDSIAGVAIDVGGRGFVKEGGTYTRTISISDDVDTGADGWTYSFTVDGVSAGSGSISAGSSTFSISHTFPDGDHLATVVVTVVDVVSTDETTGTFPVIVQNVPPRATITGNSTATANVQYSITLLVSDPGDDTVITRQIDWGDGTVNNILTHTYTSTGTYTIEVVIEDEDGIWRAGTKRVTVN